MSTQKRKKGQSGQDITGQTFNYLTAIELLNPECKAYTKRIWKCKCKCGNIIEITESKLVNNRKKSCGCLARDLVRERNINNNKIKIGDKFGKLTVIEDLGLRKQKSRDKQWRWSLCKCECGTICEVPNNELMTGHKKSCGCLTSYGEEKIKNMLIKNNVCFKRQYSFSDLRTSNNGILKFDFAIFDNTENNKLLYLIEFDGRQHYFGYDKNTKWDSVDSYLLKYRDLLKNNYCKKIILF